MIDVDIFWHQKTFGAVLASSRGTVTNKSMNKKMRKNTVMKRHKSMKKIDRMISSGSSWLMGIKGQRIIGQAHAVIEPGKKISMRKFHQITGHTGEHLLRLTNSKVYED